MTPAESLGACPFCGHVPQDLRDALHPTGIRWREDKGIRHYIGPKDPRDGTPCWSLDCLEHEGGCGAEMSGDGRDEVISKWNRRAPALQAAMHSCEATEVIYIGDDFYWKSGTMMSSLYAVDGRRYDWGFVRRDLRNGKAVNLRPATAHELAHYTAIRDEKHPPAAEPGDPT